MEENIQVKKELKQYKYKTDKIERYASLVCLVIFFFSFNNNFLGTIFFVLAAVVLVYYFLCFRKKPPYVIIDGKSITVHLGFFFKKFVTEESEIKSFDKYSTRIELNLNDGNKVPILASLLSENDFNEINLVLQKMKSSS